MTRVLAIFAAVLLTTALHAADDANFDDPALAQRYWGLIREIRCPLCMNESIADSGAPVAADLRREVHRLLVEGKSDDEIKDFMDAQADEDEALDLLGDIPRPDQANGQLRAAGLAAGARLSRRFSCIRSHRRRSPARRSRPLC